MIQILLTFSLLSVLSTQEPSKVYICDSENAVAYHYKRDCRGLKQCKHDVLKVTKEEALERKLKRCGWEN
jgi:hypothetical protein